VGPIGFVTHINILRSAKTETYVPLQLLVRHPVQDIVQLDRHEISSALVGEFFFKHAKLPFAVDKLATMN